MALIARKYFLCDLINETAQATTQQQPGVAQLQQVKALKLDYFSDWQQQHLFDEQEYASYELDATALTLQKQLALSHLRIYQEVATNSAIADDDLFLVVEEGVVLAADWQARVASLAQYFDAEPELNLLLLNNNQIPDFNSPELTAASLNQVAILTQDSEIHHRYNFLGQEQHLCYATGLRRPSSACYLMRKRAIKVKQREPS